MSPREQILAGFTAALGDEPLEKVEGAFVRELSVEETEQLQGLTGSTATGTAFVMAVVDSAGTPLFTLEDLPQLKRLKGRQFGRWVGQVMRVNGLAASASEDAEKN